MIPLPTPVTDPMTAAAPAHGALFYVAAVNLIIWVGLFAYLFYLDLKVRGALARRNPEDTN